MLVAEIMAPYFRAESERAINLILINRTPDQRRNTDSMRQVPASIACHFFSGYAARALVVSWTDASGLSGDFCDAHSRWTTVRIRRIPVDCPQLQQLMIHLDSVEEIIHSRNVYLYFARALVSASISQGEMERG